jgi:hypothetical protein
MPCSGFARDLAKFTRRFVRARHAVSLRGCGEHPAGPKNKILLDLTRRCINRPSVFEWPLTLSKTIDRPNPVTDKRGEILYLACKSFAPINVSFELIA